MYIAIIDDENNFRDEIFNLLITKYQGDNIDTFKSTEELLNSEINYDLLLLDIELPQENGITFAKKYRFRFPFIIFVSSHDEMVYSSFCSNVYGFIKKACLEKDLLSTIEEFEFLILHRAKFAFNTQSGNITVYEDEIMYFDFCDDSIYLHTNKDVKRIFETSLNKLEKKLSDTFFRINRKILVNLNSIVEVKRGTRCILLQNNERCYITEKRWNDFKLKFAYIRGESHGKSN